MVTYRERGIGGYGTVVYCEQYRTAVRRESTVGQVMITCNATFAPYVLWLITIGTVERVHLHHVVEESRPISIGATEADVLAILGEPNGRYDHNWLTRLQKSRGPSCMCFIAPMNW